ncbi:M23 family metallopeptidase [Verrucosispora sp. WMMD573]|uniref:murein hydrolase activator EnvC family protein n=1 Tax=Verrucosispora sp. WMMD573 TaxID=3015149 RepID=UPI00248B8B84|nr:M23 family metallopeptidase [Verrucosispora sp. WMMD573]WBB56950.1 M23 family metallopeptidase [Verrucosispora sp. WMMD573]
MRPRMPILGGLTTLLLLTPSGSAGGVALPNERSFFPATPQAGTGATGPFRWPVDGVPRPVRRFDPPPRPWLAGHRGVDLLAPSASTIRAAGAGTILFAGMVANRPVVTVGHPDGLRTTYEPVQPAVTAGMTVPAGAPLGTLLPGHAGCPAAACLHWGLRQGDDYLDPLALLGLGRVRLLPVGDLTVGGVRPLNAGRADRAVRPPVARTPRARCRPGRTGAASRGRSRS